MQIAPLMVVRRRNAMKRRRNMVAHGSVIA